MNGPPCIKVARLRINKLVTFSIWLDGYWFWCLLVNFSNLFSQIPISVTLYFYSDKNSVYGFFVHLDYQNTFLFSFILHGSAHCDFFILSDVTKC